MGELLPLLSEPDPYPLTFTAIQPTVLTVETLSGEEGLIRLDGSKLAWQSAGAGRPDVLWASPSITPGSHTLVFSDIPPQGLTFGLSSQNIQVEEVPFQQGVHAGRRLLLAEPVTEPDVVDIFPGQSLTVEFKTLPAYAVLDLGRVVHGKIVADVVGPAGAILDVGWDERLLTGTLRPLPYPGSLHPEWDQTDSWIMDGNIRTISTFDARTGRYLLLAAWGNGPVRLTHLRVYEERYPVTLEGVFHSSDPRLDHIWQVGVDTLYPNMTDAYADPWRERGQWWGDAYVDDHVNQVAFGDTAILRRGLRLMAEAFDNGQPEALAPNGEGVNMLDYGMLWVQSLHDDWRRTGETQVLLDVYPVLREFMIYLKTYANPDTGLLDVPVDHWSKTAVIDWRGVTSRYGQSTAINAMYYGTLLNAADLADALGDSLAALAWRQEAAVIRQQANHYLYLNDQHRYVASLLNGEMVEPSPHAQAWALAYGLTPETETDAVVASLLEMLSVDPTSPSVEIYGMFWVLEALGQAGRVPQALNLVRAHYGRLLDLGATTWWETFNANLRYTAALSHGWGGAPTWFLTTYVLGTRQSGPTTWLVQPSFSGVITASGALPMSEGKLNVRWATPDCRTIQLDITSPPNTTGDAVLPLTILTLTLNSDVIWSNGVPLTDAVTPLPDGLHVALDAGDYRLHADKACYPLYLSSIVR
jgi:alpha-L-rhamnosidase